MTTDSLAKLLERIIREVAVADPEAVEVVALPPVQGVSMIRIEVAPEEVGRVIGEQGAFFKGLEKILLAFSFKEGVHVELMRLDDPGDDVIAAKYGKFKVLANWPRAKVERMILDLAKAVFAKEAAIKMKSEDGRGGTTIVSMSVSPDEDHDVIHLMQIALRDIFNAVGRANGRIVIVDLKHPAPGRRGRGYRLRDRFAQPESADGRFAKAARR